MWRYGLIVAAALACVGCASSEELAAKDLAFEQGACLKAGIGPEDSRAAECMTYVSNALSQRRAEEYQRRVAAAQALQAAGQAFTQAGQQMNRPTVNCTSYKVGTVVNTTCN